MNQWLRSSGYLESKTQLSAKIINVILKLEGFPEIKENNLRTLRLGEAAEEFGRKIDWAVQNPQQG